LNFELNDSAKINLKKNFRNVAERTVTVSIKNTFHSCKIFLFHISFSKFKKQSKTSPLNGFGNVDVAAFAIK
jgi:hypothetical protein